MIGEMLSGIGRLYRNDRGVELYDPDVILDTPAEAFDGLLTPLQVARIKQAILDEVEQSLRRRRAGHVARIEQTALPVRLIENLYTATGGGLEQAVADALNHVGLSATRLVRQPFGEADIQLAHPNGTVVISVTASQDDIRPVRWSKHERYWEQALDSTPSISCVWHGLGSSRWPSGRQTRSRARPDRAGYCWRQSPCWPKPWCVVVNGA